MSEKRKIIINFRVSEEEYKQFERIATILNSARKIRTDSVGSLARAGRINKDFVSFYEPIDYNDIVQHTKKVKSTISWHLSWLRNAGIITVRSGVIQTYRLINKGLVARLMNKNQKSAVSS